MAAPKSKKVAVCSYLPDDLWERIFKSLKGNRRTLKLLSVVSKQFLSITSGFVFSLKITHETIPFLFRLFQRFHNLTSLNLILSCKINDSNVLLTQISTFSLSHIKSLHLTSKFNSNIPVGGLRALSKKMINLTSFNCLRMVFSKDCDLSIITDCFPLLQRKCHRIYYLAPVQRKRLKLHKRQTIGCICKKYSDILQEIIMSK